MSTEHHGPYCAHKDKMMLSRQQARAIARRQKCQVYQCEHCGSWHLARKLKPQQRLARRYRAAKNAKPRRK